MCGIIALFGEEVDISSHLLNHRGPDDYKSQTLGKCRMDFYRLAINDLTPAGMQPFRQGSHMLVCNGEIYNHRDFPKPPGSSQSDCEVILPLIEAHGIEKALNLMNGDFAFVVSDGKRIMAARDPIGVRPLFYTRYGSNSIAFASEAKALLCLNSKIDIFPPGHFYDSYFDNFVCYYTGYWRVDKQLDFSSRHQLRETFEEAVHTRIENTEREIGFLLSGGLDSSLIASIATRKLGRIKTFSIGVTGSPDLEAARVVSKRIQIVGIFFRGRGVTNFWVATSTSITHQVLMNLLVKTCVVFD